MEALNIDIDACWSRIGVWGREEPRCERLQQVTHCQNCPVYSDAGRRLLDRAPPQGYVEEWTGALATQKEELADDLASVIVFRVGTEWFALPTSLLREITEIRAIHSIPHRTNPVLRGITNIRGELHLCVSLGYLFGLEKADRQQVSGRKIHERIVVMEKDGERYVFPVSEVLAVHRYRPDDLSPAPSTVSNASGTFITGLLDMEDRRVGCLDAELLFHALRKKVS